MKKAYITHILIPQQSAEFTDVSKKADGDVDSAVKKFKKKYPDLKFEVMYVEEIGETQMKGGELK